MWSVLIITQFIIQGYAKWCPENICCGKICSLLFITQNLTLCNRRMSKNVMESTEDLTERAALLFKEKRGQSYM